MAAPVESSTTARAMTSATGSRTTVATTPSTRSISRLMAACHARIGSDLHRAASAIQDGQQRLRHAGDLVLAHVRPDGKRQAALVEALSIREVARLVAELALVVGMQMQR